MHTTKRGKFIVLDGIDGSGKGTQLQYLSQYLFNLQKTNHILITREPYISNAYQKIRALLKSGKNPRDNAALLTRLFIQDRKQHALWIKKELRAGHHVISDRYSYSTFAYQQTQGMELPMLKKMHAGILVPDLAIIVDVPVKVTLFRQTRDGVRKFQEVFEKSEFKEFQETLRKNFLTLPRQLPSHPLKVINGNRRPEQVFTVIQKEVDKLFQE